MLRTSIKIGLVWLFFFGLSVFLWSFLFPHEHSHARKFLKIYPAARDLWWVGYDVADSLYEEKDMEEILSDREKRLAYIKKKVRESAMSCCNKQRPFGFVLREDDFLLYTPVATPIEEGNVTTDFFIAAAFKLPEKPADLKRKDECVESIHGN